MKVRLKSARAQMDRSWRVGQVADLPEAVATRLLADGEAVPVAPGEPDWIPPAGLEQGVVVLTADAAQMEATAPRPAVAAVPQRPRVAANK
jgi:hypothetical protein